MLDGFRRLAQYEVHNALEAECAQKLVDELELEVYRRRIQRQKIVDAHHGVVN